MSKDRLVPPAAFTCDNFFCFTWRWQTITWKGDKHDTCISMHTAYGTERANSEATKATNVVNEEVNLYQQYGAGHFFRSTARRKLLH